ncbi:hypothetical protein LPTSP3_g13910 [Leptospira kobayashii]|uniref:Hint domain-containing protein n=1 Tax=Leptospira kobayashii TaxID=1917830 RepID=A0ABN6KCG4_9LEPT|nr:TIGR04388 family protein [Leptospira kobayashii]BDA78461.1 hypothetical protein LPTSP3_g13910 [Leptospira kobayashii]
MLTEQKTESEFSTFTRTQAGLGLFSFVFSLFFAGAVFSQEVVPQLQMDEYNANLMNQVYGQSYFLNSLNSWTDQVTYYKGLLRASWESAADNAIYNYVSSITTSDTYNTVDAYKDYVQKELDSQKMVALNSWDDKANLDFLANKNQFVARLTTNQFDQAYIERVGGQQQYQQVLTENQRVNQLQNNIANAANNWNVNFNQSYQSGLNDFANTLGNIQDQYNSFLTNLDESEATFQNNLTAIDSYKTVVKNAISGIVSQFQGMLDQSCNQASPCLYRQANNGGLNAAGQTMTALVTSLNTVLNDTSLNPTNILTTISAQINNFLSSQTNSAYLTYADYTTRIDTFQNTWPPTAYGIGADWNYIIQVNNGSRSFNNVPANQRAVWEKDTAGLFSGVGDSTFKGILNAIHSGNNGALAGYITANLQSGQSLTNILATNIYTDWNNAKNSDGFAWTGTKNTQMNLRANNGDPWHWGADRATLVPFPWAWTDWFQMGSIGYEVVYEMHDGQAATQAAYWNGNYGSLNGQLNQYLNQITPAIRNWESQVASYNSFHEQWKVSADALKAQAKTDYENALVDLEAKKSAWVQKMEAERRDSILEWNNLSEKAAQAQSTAELQNVNKQLSSTYNASISGLNISTNASEVMNSYNGSINDLSSREFTFVEPTPIESPVLNNGLINPKDALSALSISALGNKIVSQDMVFGLSGALGVNSIQKDAFVYSSLSSDVAGAVGGLLGSGSTGSSGGQKFSIMNAASEKTVDTSLTINGKDVSEIFGKTTNGVYQYSQLLSINESNSFTAKQEQAKLVNQMAYTIDWSTRAGAKLDDNGNLSLNAGGIGNISNDQVLAILKKQSEYSYKGEKMEGYCVLGAADYTSCQEREKRLSDAQTADFNAKFAGEIALLKSQGYEFQGGMIVKSLSRDEKIRTGQTDADMKLTDAEKQQTGSCYIDPAQCAGLIKQEFTITYDNVGGVTLSKIISDGKIAGKGDKGYYSGTQNETRYISLSTVNPVTAPKGKDLFDEWGEEDWNDVEDQKTAVMNDFFTNGLGHDSKMLTQATTQIRNTESTNEKKFQEAKTAQEAADSLLKDLLIAYISGGMAGVKASIKGKIEDQINSGLAAAFIRATGGSDDQIAMATQLVSFMRGKMQERKIKSNMAKNNLTNVAMGGLAIMTGGASLLLGSAMGAMGSFAAGVGSMFGSATAVLGATFGSSIAGLTAGVTTAAYRAVAGDKAADALVNKISGPKDQLAAIKANENAIIKTAATGAIANATGLPKDLVGQLLTDYQGAQAAKKVRKAVNSNPLGNIGSQVVGAVGGIIKTAIVATGVPERDIQRALSDGNRIMFAGVTDAGMEAQSLAYMNQAMGMSAPGMKYTSNIPTLKNKEGLVEELGQRIVVDEIVKATGMDKDVADAAFRKQYGAIKQKKADKKAQSSAIRSTVVTAVTTAVTLGAAAAVTGPLAAVNSALSSIGSFVGASANAAVQVGAAVVKGAIQAIDGARNGIQGVLAGVANGAIGVLTAGVSPGVPMGTTFEPGAFLSTAASALQKTGVGLGISYDRQAGWGGAVGIGNGSANASITFSQHGGSQINVGVQGATINYNTANGTYGAGYTYNAGNGFSVGAAWNSATGASATAGLNVNGYGVSITADSHGTSSTASVGGIAQGTNGPDGFHAAEIDWVEQNLDQARNNNDVELARRVKVGEDKYLAEKYKLSPEEIDKLSPDARDALIKAAAVVSGPQGNEAWGTSRLSGLDQFVGGFTDGIANVANFYNGDAASSDAVYVSPDGTVHPRTCFTAGTLIHTKDGLKAIEEIKVGDEVLSWKEVSQEISYKRVTELFTHDVELIYEIEIDKKEKLQTTWNHPFWIVEKQAWVETKDLEIGNTVLLSNGNKSSITNVTYNSVDSTAVYNFEVEENHTYYVGKKGVLVHNYLESVWDAASLGMGVVALADAINRGDNVDIAIAGTFIVIDGVALALPVIPGGAGAWLAAIKGGQVGVKAGKVILKNSDEVVEAGVKLKGANNPKVKAALEKGKKAHAEMEYPPGFKKEVVLPSGKRMDAYNKASKEVIELKPNNPRAIKKGEKQLKEYCNECDRVYGPGHKGTINTYE